MRSDIVTIANRLIPKPASVQRVKDRYVTDDIINEVLLKFEQCKDQLQNFAPYLRGDSVEETCRNVWAFWRKNITYIADDAPAGKQIVKSPAAVWEDKFCDCKSFSVAVLCCLHCLGIRSVFRFVSFSPVTKTIPTHVYNVAKHNGREIVIDCCLPDFNKEKMYAAKYDYLQPGLYSVTGIGKPGFPGFIKRKRKRGELRIENVQTEAELGLLIHEQRLELEQDLAAKVHGIGSTIDNCYQVELAAINNAICTIGNPALCADRKPVMLTVPETFIGKPKDRNIKKAEKKAKKEEKKIVAAKKKNEAGKAVNKKDAKRLEKLNITVAKKKEGILKKVAKVITAPVRLVQKGIIQATLPKSAPAFLYLFINDKRILDKAPAVVLSKRNKAQQYADRVINKIGMKKDHFMGILRNGIMQNMGDTPENVLSRWMADAGFRIGFISEILEGAKGLASLLGGKAAELMNDAPDPSDWGVLSSEVKNEFGNAFTNQASNNDVKTGNGTVPIRTEDQNYNTGYNYGNTSFGTYNSKPTYNEDDYGTGDFGKGNYEGKDLEEAIVTAKKQAPEPVEEESGNSGVIIAALVIAAVAFSSGGKKKTA